MIVKDAKDVARQWVIEEACKLPGFYGAFHHGSTNWLLDNTALPATSDVDVMVVIADANLPDRLGMFNYRDVILDVTYVPSDRLQSPDMVLGDYHMAGHFRTPNIILDPSGQLTRLQATVSRDYAKRQWVYTRCRDTKNKILRYLDGVNEAELFHDQVTCWLFATGITTHMLLVAGLKSPTVRRRYLATRELLADYGYLDFYGTLLEMLGCARMGRGHVEHHLAVLTEAFDAAKAQVKTPYRFASYISDVARSFSIDGSRELIEQGYHRETLFWIIATYSRCQTILHHDASVETQEKYSRGYRQLLGDLGITSFADLQQRGEQVKGLLPRVWQVTEAIIGANQEIEDEVNATP